MWVANLLLDISLDNLNVALDALFVNTIQILTDIVLITELHNTMVRFHILPWLHDKLLGREVLQDGVAVLLNLGLAVLERQLIGELFLKIHF